MKRCVRIEAVRNSGRSSWPSRRTVARRASVGWRRNRSPQRRRQPRALGFQTLEPRIALSVNLPTNPRDFAVVGNVAYFSAYDTAYGEELWRTDGTRAGTTLVKDLYEGTYTDVDMNGNDVTRPNSSEVRGVQVVNGKVYFAAVTETDEGIWTTDGTAEGTSLALPDFQLSYNEFAWGTEPYGSRITVFGDSMYLFGQNAEQVSGLWRWDGTPQGISLVVENAYLSMMAFGNKLFFVQDISPSESGLFATDGSDAAPELIRSFPLPAMTEFDVRPPSIIGQFGGSFYLSAPDAANGVELWKSDGTTAGTQLVRDINPGSRTGTVGFDDNGDPITGNLPNHSIPNEVFGIGSGVAVLSAFTQATGRELWRTDGTANGTTLVKDLVPGSVKYEGTTYPNDSSPSGFTSYGGSTFFTTFDGSLWKTDGTSKGTVTVKKMGVNASAMGYGSGSPAKPVAINGRLLYSAYNTKTAVFDIWSSDGTAAGTMRLQDLPPTITSVTLPDAGTYGAGQTLQFTVTFTDAVVVTGKSSLQLTVGKATKLATYFSGSGTNQLVYRYTVGKNDLDTDGIAVASKLVGSITSAAASKVKALLTVPALATAGIRVDAAPPTVISVTAPENRNYAVGETLAFLVRFNEVVRVTGVPQIAVTFGKTVLQAGYVSGDGTDTLRFEVLAEAVAPTGVKLATSIVLTPGSTITDSWGNVAPKLSFKAPVTSGVKVVPQPIDLALYQGEYEGSFGTMASGPINATVVDRTITVAIVVNAPSFGINGVPANGTGTIATDGSFSFTATGGLFGVTFTGQVFPGQNGAVSASGTWRNSRASGTWRVDRISNAPPA